MKAGWQSKPIGELCNFYNGLWSGKKPPFATAGVFRNTNFGLDGALKDSEIAVLEVEEKQLLKRRLQFGDIILEKSGGGPKQAVGRVAFYDKTDGVHSFSNFTSAIRVNDPAVLSPHYLLKFLLWTYLSGVTEGMQSHSTGIRNLNGNAYKQIVIPLPPLDEQRRIVAVLDKAFAGIATATANARKNLTNARALFDNFLSSKFGDGASDWPATTIADVCTLRSGTTVNANLEQPCGEIPYLKVADMSHPANLEEVTSSSRFLRKCDIGKNALIPAGATIFPKRGGAIMTNKKRLITVPIAADLNIMAAIPGDSILPRFLRYYFENVDMKKLGSGSSIPQINNYDIEPLVIHVPSKPIQTSLIEKADALKQATTNLERVCREKLATLTELKQSLLRQAFAGELT